MTDDHGGFLDRRLHPVEALVARLLSPTRGEAWVQFRDEMYERKLTRAAQVVETAAEESGLSPSDLLDQARSDERRADLLDMTMATAMTTTSREKLRGLGRVLAAGITADNETTVDASCVLSRIIAEMDPPHIRALALIADRGGFNPGLATGVDALGQWLQAKFPGLGSVSNQVGAFLVGNGLVTNPFYVNGTLSVTELGRGGAGAGPRRWGGAVIGGGLSRSPLRGSTPHSRENAIKHPCNR
jgi:hypothetical protein